MRTTPFQKTLTHQSKPTYIQRAPILYHNLPPLTYHNQPSLLTSNAHHIVSKYFNTSNQTYLHPLRTIPFPSTLTLPIKLTYIQCATFNFQVHWHTQPNLLTSNAHHFVSKWIGTPNQTYLHPIRTTCDGAARCDARCFWSAARYDARYECPLWSPLFLSGDPLQ